MFEYIIIVHMLIKYFFKINKYIKYKNMNKSNYKLFVFII